MFNPKICDSFATLGVSYIYNIIYLILCVIPLLSRSSSRQVFATSRNPASAVLRLFHLVHLISTAMITWPTGNQYYIST